MLDDSFPSADGAARVILDITWRGERGSMRSGGFSARRVWRELARIDAFVLSTTLLCLLNLQSVRHVTEAAYVLDDIGKSSYCPVAILSRDSRHPTRRTGSSVFNSPYAGTHERSALTPFSLWVFSEYVKSRHVPAVTTEQQHSLHVPSTARHSPGRRNSSPTID
jgi:hypothetical protein